jgi:restriction endonuclease
MYSHSDKKQKVDNDEKYKMYTEKYSTLLLDFGATFNKTYYEWLMNDIRGDAHVPFNVLLDQGVFTPLAEFAEQIGMDRVDIVRAKEYMNRLEVRVARYEQLVKYGNI